MNRKQKIIVSVTGIFIVLLALVGLTFAYFLTQIRGNEENKSISVTTANLVLEYGDGNNIISMSNIMPGDPIPVKTFTVTNKGNATVNNYKVYLESVQNQLELKDDLKYTLTCKSYKTTNTTVDFSTLTENGTCIGAESTTFPSVMNLIATNTINEGYTHYYELKVEYLYQNYDQSVDMNKTVSAKVNIYDEKSKSLATEILANVKASKNGTTLLDEPATPVAESHSAFKENMELDSCDKGFCSWLPFGIASTPEEAVEKAEAYDFGVIFDEEGNEDNIATCDFAKGKYISDNGNPAVGPVLDCSEEGYPIVEGYTDEYEKSMSTELDDYGTSYYYRGSVEDNYLNFADMCWRIVRIQGDGSIKLILEDKTATCDSENYIGNWLAGTGNYGYDSSSGKYIANYLEPVTDAENSMVKAFYDFQETFTAEEKSKLKAGDWCLNDTAYTRNDTAPYKYTLIDKDTDRYTLDDFYYDSYVRLSGESEKGYQPTLKCNGTNMDKFGDETTPMYVGTLTADEMMYAGGKHYENYMNVQDYSYLIPSDYSGISSEENFGPITSTLSLAKFEKIYVVEMINNSIFTYQIQYDVLNFRPAVILEKNTPIVKGDGTQMNPYVVE